MVGMVYFFSASIAESGACGNNIYIGT